MSPVGILTAKEQKSSSFKNFNHEILRSEILKFNFDEDCVYDFSENQIKKIAKIDTKSCENVKNYNLQIEFDDENLINNILNDDIDKTNTHSTLINDSNQFTNISFKTLTPLDKLLFLENKINSKNKEITREILQILTELEDLDFVKDDCVRVYEKLIESGELIEELFDYKRDIRILFKCKELSEVYLLEYAIFLNKNLLPIFYCECSKCLICKIISPLKFEKLVKITTNTQFYKQDSTKLTYDQILNLKFDLFKKIKTHKTFYHVLFGFTGGQIFEKLAKNENLSLYTCVLSLFCKDLKLDYSKMDVDCILDAYDKAQSFFWHLKVENGLFLVDQFDFHYKTLDEIEKDLNKTCALKELVKILKIRTTQNIQNNVQNNLPLCFFLPFSSIFILKSIFKHNPIPFYLVYEIYDKIHKFIIPFSFYDALFKNQNDFLIHFFRAKELFKLFELTQDKFYLNKCLKYIDKKIKDTKNYKFRLLKCKIVIKINCQKEAFYEIQRFKNLETFKTLAFSDLPKAIQEISLLKNDKASLLFLELQVFLKENLEIGMLFNKDSCINNENINNYLQFLTPEVQLSLQFLTPEIQLSFIRYLKYRNLEQAHDFLEKNKKINNDKVHYESFIIKRKLGLISYRSLYKDRKSDLLNQEINYIENKECDESNEFYYLFLFKKFKLKDHNSFNFFYKEILKGNGDCLLILRILYGVLEETLFVLKTLHQVENGFYWSRTRKILDFKKRLEHTIEIFEYDQKY